MNKILSRRRLLIAAAMVAASMAVAAFVGYQVDWLQQRRAFVAGPCQLGPICAAPLALRPFSETGYSLIQVPIRPLPNKPTAAELERRETAQRLFPEAEVGFVAIYR
jgi:hypothetical protein